MNQAYLNPPIYCKGVEAARRLLRQDKVVVFTYFEKNTNQKLLCWIEILWTKNRL